MGARASRGWYREGPNEKNAGIFKNRAIHDFIAGTVVVRANLEDPPEDESLES